MDERRFSSETTAIPVSLGSLTEVISPKSRCDHVKRWGPLAAMQHAPSPPHTLAR